MKEFVVLAETWGMESEKYCFMTIVMSIIYSYAAAASKIQVKKEKKSVPFFFNEMCNYGILELDKL